MPPIPQNFFFECVPGSLRVAAESIRWANLPLKSMEHLREFDSKCHNSAVLSQTAPKIAFSRLFFTSHLMNSSKILLRMYTRPLPGPRRVIQLGQLATEITQTSWQIRVIVFLPMATGRIKRGRHIFPIFLGFVWLFTKLINEKKTFLCWSEFFRQSK